MIALLIPLLLVCCIGPGLMIAGRFRWSAVEKLCGVFVISFLAVYLVSLALFCIDAGSAAYWGASIAFLIMGLAGRQTAYLLIRNHGTRTVLLSFCAILAWDFLHLGLVLHYNGGNWAVDWHEHFDRTRYFMHLLPRDYLFVNRYTLSARPPMMNLMAAFFCQQVGLSFESYSVVFTFLNAWAFVPCCFLLRFFGRRGRRMIPALIVLFMLNPSIMENATLTVTKALAAGLVVLGVCFYLRRRIETSAMSLAAGMLVHYSAGPYALAIGLHCLATKSPKRWLPAAILALLLLGTWLGFSLQQFGFHQTLFSSTTATGSRVSTASNIGRAFYDAYTSLVPFPLRLVHDELYLHLDTPGKLGDFYFMMAQTTLPMMIGISGGLVAAWLIVRYFLSAQKNKVFWAFFLIFTLIIGSGVNPDWAEYGAGQVTLQSLALIGVTLVAASLRTLRPVIFRLLLFGLLVDYCFGVILQFYLESQPYSATLVNGKWIVADDTSFGFNGPGEYRAKLVGGYTFLGDHLVNFREPLLILSAAAATCAIWYLTRFYRIKGRPRGI